MIPGTNLLAVDDVVFFNNPDTEPGQIIVARRIHPRHLGSFASDQRGPGHLTSCCNSGDHRLGLCGRKRSSSKIVEKVERFGTHHQNIVDTHCDEVDADRVVAIERDGQFEFGAHAVCPRDQHRPLVLSGRQFEESAKAADTAQAFRPLGLPHQRLDTLYQIITGVDIDACITVTERGIA